ncbi:T9SS type A sorting domain-containing protein [uncultured Winogradskyella sp.]|uniref:T9SS type A sorting domain-containing protein n=1 Tax=uncultured Winogradskyella sp. TaxID=395353 RepID=UPI003518E3EC
MRQFYIFALTLIFGFTNVQAQLGTDSFILATDDASNYPGGTWNTTTNGGNGFGSWSFISSGTGGRYIGGTGLSTLSFGINSENGGLYAAERAFNRAMQPGDTFSVNVGHTTTINGEIFIQFLDGSTPVFTLKFVSGGSDWQINDGGSDFGSGQAYDDFASIAFTFTYEGGNNYSYTFGTGSGSNFTASSNISNITSVKFQSTNQGALQNFGFDDLEITSKYTIPNGQSTNVTSDITVPYLEIQAGGAVTVQSGNTLTVTNDPIVLNSTSTEFASFINNGTYTGDITYNRYTAQVGPTGTNDLIASPVSGQDFGPFATANSGALAASENIRAFAPFNPVANAYTNYDTGTNANTAITPGTGYRAGTQAFGGETLAFTGTPNNGAVPVTLVDGTSFWNLIGNPYPSYLSALDFLNANSANLLNNTFFGIYGYDADDTDGSIWTQIDFNFLDDPGNPGTPIDSYFITPGQGFFVAAPSGGGDGIEFTTTMRRTGTSDDFITGRNAANTNNFAHAILNLNTASTSYETNVYFRDINTLGLDPGYDTGAYDQNANGVYTHLVEDNAGIALFNQSLPYANLTDVVVPLVVNLNPNEQMTFSLNSNSVVPESIDVILEDSVENTFTLLNSGDYTITPSTVLSGSGRFFLRFAENALSTVENELDSLFIFANANKQIVISGLLDTTSTAQVYDLQGRAVMSQTLNANVSTQTINASALTSGIYIVEVSNGTLSKTQKIILR